MPLFEVGLDGLVPFHQVESDPEALNSTVEDAFWRDLDTLTGEQLFRVQHNPTSDGDGRPAVVALDREGSVLVVTVRHVVDRIELAECLEFAEWAGSVGLDELAATYWRGPEYFLSDWQEFAQTPAPIRERQVPRLLVVAGEVSTRTGATLQFLAGEGFPVTLVRAILFEDAQGRRVLDLRSSDDARGEGRHVRLAEEESGSELSRRRASEPSPPSVPGRMRSGPDGLGIDQLVSGRSRSGEQAALPPSPPADRREPAHARRDDSGSRSRVPRPSPRRTPQPGHATSRPSPGASGTYQSSPRSSSSPLMWDSREPEGMFRES